MYADEIPPVDTWKKGTVYVQQRPKGNSSITHDVHMTKGKDIDYLEGYKNQSEKTQLASNLGDRNEREKFDSVRNDNITERKNLMGGLPPISINRSIAGQDNQSSMMTNTV